MTLKTIVLILSVCLIFFGAFIKIQGWSRPTGQVMLELGMAGIVIYIILGLRASRD